MKSYKKMLIILLIILSAGVLISIEAKAYGLVEYLGDSEKFIFSPGSDASKKELFVEHESIMPGDKIEDVVEIRNKASEKVDIQVYVRAIDIDESKENFLSNITMHIKQNEEQVLHSSKAAEAISLQDWMYLGEVNSGNTMNAILELDVPSSLDNRYTLSSGELKWQFKVVEISATETAVNANDDEGNQNILFGKGFLKTGDNSFAGVVTLVFAISLLVWLVIGLKKERRKKDEEVK